MVKLLLPFLPTTWKAFMERNSLLLLQCWGPVQVLSVLNKDLSRATTRNSRISDLKEKSQGPFLVQ